MKAPRFKTAIRRTGRFRRGLMALAMAAITAAGPATAQILPGLGRNLGAAMPAVGDLATHTVGTVDGLGQTADRLVDLRLERLQALVRANPKALDLDGAGQPVVRGEVLALSPSEASLKIAAQAGFTVVRRSPLAALGLEEVVLAAPQGLSTKAAVRRLRALDPSGQYDFDHLYAEAGDAGAGPAGERPARASPGRAAATAGLIDTGVGREHPALASNPIEQKGFAPGGVKPAEHGTAVASLMVGQAAGFRGAAPGARLYAADVYGDGPTGGSADAIVAALAWMAQNHVPVINISLVGPSNLTLAAGVRVLVGRGVLIVAPVGNDGPAAPPMYPAAYPGVIAVTAVDPHRRPLIEAGRAAHLDFAAPGAGIRAARLGGGFMIVRGTSFASPIVAGKLALLLPAPDPAQAAQAVAELAASADKRGGGSWGRGLAGEEFATAPH